MICPRKILALGLLAALAVTLSGAAPPPKPSRQQGQLPPPPPPQAPGSDDTRAIIRARVDLVVVPVTVKDSSGELVADLRQDEFRVLEDGVEQKIPVLLRRHLSALGRGPARRWPEGQDFRTREADSDHHGRGLQRIRRSGRGAIRRLLHSDPGFHHRQRQVDHRTQERGSGQSVHFDDAYGDRTAAAVPSAGDQRAPGAVPTSNPFKATNTKHIDDALYARRQMLRTRDRERRKVIVLVSDGTNARNNTHTYDETLKLLLSSDVSVYAIGLDSAVILRGTTVLSRYAHATGGDVYYAAHESDLPNLYAQVSEQARHQYTIGYLLRADRSGQGLSLDRSSHSPSRADPAHARRLLSRFCARDRPLIASVSPPEVPLDIVAARSQKERCVRRGREPAMRGSREGRAPPARRCADQASGED